MATETRPANRRGEILDHASRLFSAHGYDGTAIRLIARASGVTEAAIYRHFDGKAQLYDEVIRAKVREHDIAGDLAGHRGRGGIEDVLRAVANHVLSLAQRDPELVRLMSNSSLENDQGRATIFREVRSPYIDFLVEEITRRMAAGEVRRIDPVITSRCFVGMVMDCALNAAMWSRLAGAEVDAQTVVCNNVPIFARGLTNDGAASPSNDGE
ncbi:MAG: TetR/AcrR family transcriptional regulator [bacterium]|nr:TetR/AcrR family transcriptional regulator [bacterium]